MDDKLRSITKEVVRETIELLEGRKKFKTWWADLPEEHKAEIKRSLRYRVKRVLKNNGVE